MGWGHRGVIEGFYGPPWSWAARAAVMRSCHERGMDLYLYGPKDDPLHRERWRDLYPSAELDGFASLVAEDTLQVGFAISPGLSIDTASADDRAALAAKVDQVVDLGVGAGGAAVRRHPVRPGLGPEHAELTTWLHDHLDGRAELILTPTEYAGTEPSPYLDALAAGLPEDVLIGWTGRRVVCDEITVAEAQARADALGGRPPFVWDNYPVNDGLMADQLFLGPLRGREPGLDSGCSGYVANPMVQPMASTLPLASIAGYLAGDDPEAAWQDAAGPWRTFAEACDGDLPRRLVAARDRSRVRQPARARRARRVAGRGEALRGAGPGGRGRALARAGARRGPDRPAGAAAAAHATRRPGRGDRRDGDGTGPRLAGAAPLGRSP